MRKMYVTFLIILLLVSLILGITTRNDSEEVEELKYSSADYQQRQRMLYNCEELGVELSESVVEYLNCSYSDHEVCTHATSDQLSVE